MTSPLPCSFTDVRPASRGRAVRWLAACGALPRCAPKLAEPAPVAARLAVAERATSDARTGFAGTVAAEKSTAVSSRVMAMVTAVHVDLGDTVAAGQALLSIDPTAAQGQVSQAQGGLAQAEAALTLAKRNLERFEALAASKLGLRARARHGAHAVRAGRRRGEAGPGRRRFRELRGARLARRGAVRRPRRRAAGRGRRPRGAGPAAGS